MTDAVVKISNVIRRFNGVTAVENLNLTVSRGSVLALLGPNGAGKTTTLRMIMNLLKPDQGTISVFGMNPAADTVAIRRRCGYVPERPRMIPWMTVKQILEFTSSFYPGWDRRYVDTLISACKLTENRKVRNLSRGEEARLALILGLAFKPELLILDDATSGIDPAARRDILENIIRAMHENGTTILFATHLLHEIEGLADEVVFLIGGKLRLAGRLEDIKQSYRRVISWADASRSQLPDGTLVLTEKKTGRSTEWIIGGYRAEAWQSLASERNLEIQELSLEEIYLAHHDESAG